MSSSRDPEEEMIADADGALEEVNSHVKEVFAILKREKVKVRKEMEASDTVAKKLENVHFSKTLKLNVGGQLFSTSLETMKKDPGSMLHAMFSGRFESKPAEDGSYFIDRDGTHFRYILNYLRTGQLVVPEDKFIRRELLSEAEFYQIQGIIKTITDSDGALEQDCKEMDAFAVAKNWLKHVHFSETLKLNVGGQLFFTSLKTMKKEPGNISNTRRVFHQADIQTPKSGLKNEGQPSFHSPLRCVWIPDGTLFRVFDTPLKLIIKCGINEGIKSPKSMQIKTGYPNLLYDSDFPCVLARLD